MKANRLIVVWVIIAALFGVIPYANAAGTPSSPSVALRQTGVVGDAYCVGPDLYVMVTVDAGRAHLEFRVNGDGPGLPTASQGPGAGDYTFIIAGPGTWTNLGFEVPGDDSGTWGRPGDWSISPTEITCSGESAEVDPVPGCDMSILLPADAVVGRFNANTEAYFAPGMPTNPPTVIEVGKTYYVIGQDATESYYKVVVSCSLVWVPKSSVGSNYDAVWHGAPLPVTVVE